MDLESGKKLALSLMGNHQLSDWGFEWNNKKRGLGVCDYTNKTIRLSRYFVGANTRFFVKHVVLHEIAHALVGSINGHNKIFKQKCKEIGAKFDKCSVKAKISDKVYNWEAKCSGCGMSHKRIKRPISYIGYSCGACNLKVPLTFKRMK